MKRETGLSVRNSLHFAELTAATIAEVLSESMLSGKPEDTSKYLKNIEQEGVVSVSVYDLNGKEVFGGDREIEIPKVVLKEYRATSLQYREKARFFMPLKNEGRCRYCHPSGALRGVVVVDIPLQRMLEDVRGTEQRMILYGVLITILGVIGTVVLANRLITQRISSIGSAIRMYMGGSEFREPEVGGNDELTEVAEAFNSMVRQLNRFHTELENMVQSRTEELRKSNAVLKEKQKALKNYSADLKRVATFSHRFVRRDRSLKEVICRFAQAMKDELGYSSAEVFLLDRESDTLERVTTTRTDEPSPVETETLLSRFNAGDIYVEEDIKGANVMVYVPIYIPRRGPCYEINNCQMTECTCYGRDERCWQIPHTKCNAVHALGMSSCRQCSAFPLRGLLILETRNYPDEHSLGILEIIAAEIALVIEIYDLIRYERNMVHYLMEIHRTFVKTRAASDVHEVFNGIVDSAVMSEIFQGFALWLKDSNGRMVLKHSNLGEELALEGCESLIRETDFTEPVERYNINLMNFYSVILCPLIRGERVLGVIGFFFTHKGFLLPEERAVAMVLTQNIAGDIENIYLRKGLEESNLALQHQKEFIEDIIKSINSGIIVVDGNDRVIKANPYALGATGFREDEIMGQPIDWVVPGLRELHEAGVNEGTIVLPSGKELYLGFSFSPFRSSDGERGSVILFRDLTEIIELRNELQRKKYFSAIGEMASLIAHEVRNPIFAISAIARILLQKYDDAEGRRFAESILKETKRLNTLIEDLLNYGRPLSLDKKLVSIHSLIHDTTTGLESFLKESNCIIQTVDVPDDQRVEVDPDRIKQVLYNVIKNAIDAGAELITIATEETDRYIKMTIRDNGRGIRPEDLERVMKPFFTTKKKGTGLGLPICRKIVEAHGGRFSIFSTEGKGTEVLILLKKADDY
ncbi:MAG: PAS domain S-box protein [Nitrospirae bacterium]|nr:PAS domain S-box protein [Nitrospirota bacterium]